MSDVDLPPEFDLGCYRAENSDLALLSDDALVAHYRDHGAGEGRVVSPATRREGLLKLVAQEDGRILEVGPGRDPVVSGTKVRYLDIATTEVLRARAPAGTAPARVPRIHYVGTVDALPRSFDAAVACRSIGHHPDLIDHLRSIARVLIDGGRYYLIVPDQRYTGAASLPLASVAGIIAAHRAPQPCHSLDSLIAHRALRLDEDVPARWAGHRHNPAPLADRAACIAAAIDEHDRTGGYIDVEAWHFTPESFRTAIALLSYLGLTSFAPVRVWPTPHHRDEFCAVLEKR